MRRKILLRILGGLAAACVLAIAGGFLWLRTSLPDLAGETRLAGLGADVELIHDRNGVPHIHAATPEDAYFALGFVHARDRLFQMDFMRRLGAGRLSEVVGSSTLQIDRTMRTLGLYRLAAETAGRMPEDARRYLDSYASGVNAFLNARSGALPPEFLALRYEPEPWSPADSLIWGRLMGQRLTSNWRTEALRAVLAKVLEPDRLADLWPVETDGPAPTIDAAATGPAFNRLFGALLRSMPDALRRVSASNSWALSGKLTASGMPLLANDPHLGFRAPGLWYLARLKAPGLDVTGATVAGVPFHVLGHNGRIAWAFTTTDSDTQDLYVERLAASGGYEGPNGPLPFAARTEEIGVRGRDPVRHEVRQTVHGPVVSDIDRRFEVPEGHVVALASAGLRPDDLTPLAILRINQARDWNEFREALRHFHSPQQNITYADVDSNIGFMAPGRVPVRSQGDGGAPVPGWTGTHEWSGFIPFDQLPTAFNPRSGRIVNANHRVVPASYRWYLTRDWPAPYRASRILEHLNSSRPRTLETEAELQNDVLSHAAKALLPLLLERADPADEQGRAAVSLLRRWDGRMSRELGAPLVFTAWLAEVNRGLYADELGEFFEEYWGLRPRVARRMLTRRTVWCDHAATDAREGCGQVVTEALARALDLLRERFGEDMSEWRWGAAHEALFRHPLFGRIPVLRSLADIRVESGGGAFTVNRGQHRLNDARSPFASVHGPGYRAIYDLSSLENSRFAVATGQSGNPLSALYDNTTENWRNGRYMRIAQSREAAAREAIGILRLRPE